MKIFFTLTVVIVLAACDAGESKPRQAAQAPVKLGQESSFGDVLKSSKQDVVNQLYQNIADTTPQLKALEQEIAGCKRAKTDTLKALDDYESVNGAYYLDAGNIAEGIKDSLLRKQMQRVLAESKGAYNTSTSTLRNLAKQVEARDTAFNDFFIILKLSKTLAAMEQYQDKGRPAAGPLNNLLKLYGSSIQKVQNLAKK
jgi:hypothetical protein